MLNQEAEEKLARILVDRIEDINSSILIKIGNAIKQIGELSTTQAYQLAQILKYRWKL